AGLPEVGLLLRPPPLSSKKANPSKGGDAKPWTYRDPLMVATGRQAAEGMAEREQIAAFALHGPVICRIEPERKSVVGPSVDAASPVRGAQTPAFSCLRALAADGQRSSARVLVAVGQLRQRGDRSMLFFKKPTRPSPLRARPVLKTRLRVEQL